MYHILFAAIGVHSVGYQLHHLRIVRHISHARSQSARAEIYIAVDNQMQYSACFDALVQRHIVSIAVAGVGVGYILHNSAILGTHCGC